MEIEFVVADSRENALSWLRLGSPPAPPLILPSSGHRQDPAVASLRRRLRDLGVGSTVLLPGGLPALAPFTQPEGGAWQATTIDVPGQPAMDVALPGRLLSSRETWIVTDVDAVAGRGPHSLDLAVKYIRSTDRLRGLRLRDRTWVVALNSLLHITRLFSIARFDGLVVASSTTDLIAGELAALAIAELRLPHSRSVTGVWEDPLVQRATELQLGALHPGQLIPRVTISTSNTNADVVVNRIFTTIGVSPS